VKRFSALALACLLMAAVPQAATAEPSVKGWANTEGGRGGRVLRVTNLNADGPGSFKWAVEQPGKRIIVFEVSGAIDLGLKVITIRQPDLTIAGQTAPSPGITLIRGGIDIATHDVIIQHIRLRVGRSGQPPFSWESDGISTVGAHDVIVDHCSLTWALDENLSASGPRFTGSTPEQWRQGTSHNITYSYNIIAEGLAHASHPKGEHSKGSLIHDNVTNILIYRNLYAHNYERNPLLKGGVHAAVVNNLIFDPGAQAIHYNLMDLEWTGKPFQVGELSAVGNVFRAGFSTLPDTSFLSIGGVGDLDYYGRDNIAVGRTGEPRKMFGRYTTSSAKIIQVKQPPVWPAGLKVEPADQVETDVLRNAGARPWDRDADDLRVTFDVAEGRGHVIDDENEVGGFRPQKVTHAPFVESEWDLDTMEPKSGHYPGEHPNEIQQPHG
jgi:pectate lyase